MIWHTLGCDPSLKESPMKIFFSVGEPSGDLHGAKLITHLKQLRPDVECVGYGGPQMERAGCQLHFDLTRLAVMFFLRAIAELPTFWKRYREAHRYFQTHEVDAVVLIDFPGFNWWIAKAAKRAGIPVFYYGVPQMWAWAPWRVKKIRRYVDHVLCQLPFEKRWYRERGCQANFVGHPYFDELHEHDLDRPFMDSISEDGKRLLTLLPGSRNQEVESHLEWLLDSAKIAMRETPGLMVAVACYNQSQADDVRRRIAIRGDSIDVFVGRTPELIAAADCCLACSGSVSLQLMFYRTPAVIVYKINRLKMFLQSIFVRARYITLVNLLWADDIARPGRRTYDPDAAGAEKVPMPEYLTTEDEPDRVAAHAIRWLNEPKALAEHVEMLDDLAKRFAKSGSSERTAVYLLSHLESASTTKAA